MPSIAWHILEAHFWEALERPSGERAAYLDAACGEDGALRERLEVMLSNHEKASAFIEALRSGILPPPVDGGSWHGVFRLVEALVGQDPKSRASHLEELDEADPDGRLLVEALVQEWFASQPGDEQPGPERQPDPHRLVGTQVRHYDVQAWLGGGGMGVVYRAEDTKLRRTVALKFLPPGWGQDARLRERFMREAQAASAFDHPNICTIHEVSETDDGRLFIAMAYYEGETLKKKIEGGLLPLAVALDLALQVAHGLTQAHERGIIHRDVKPANVMVTAPASGGRAHGLVKVLDFGLARLAGATHLTREGTALGTVAYMSPEQARGEQVDHRTDVWALGIVLFEMLTGLLPFDGDYEQALLYAIVNEPPTKLEALRPDLPPALDAIVARCLAKDPAERYENMSALAEDLQALHAPEPPFRRWGRRPQVRFGLPFSAAGLLALMLLAMPGLRQATLQGLGFDVLPLNKRIVVLPPGHAGIDAEDGVFVAGFHHTLTSRLGRLEQLQPSVSVSPVGDVRKYDVQTAGEARERLGANLVFESFVWRVGERLHFTITLIDPKTQRILDSFEEVQEHERAGALQTRILSKCLSMLDKHLPAGSRATVIAGGTVDPEAEKLYIEGQGYLQRRSEGAHFIQAATLRFTRALARDSTFALAYAGLGEAYWRQYEATEDPAWVPRAIAHSRRALALRDDLAPVYVSLGLIHAGQGDYAASQEAFEKALAIEPGNVEALRERGKVYAGEGQDALAEQTYRQAVTLQPDNWKGYNSLGAFFVNRGRYAEAVAVWHEAMAIVPENRSVLNNLAVAYWRMGHVRAAMHRWEEVLAVEPDYFFARKNLGTAYFYSGRFDEAARQYEQALALRPKAYDVIGYLGDAYMAARQPEPARAAYRRGLALTRPNLQVDPNDTDVLGRMAWYFLHLGHPDSTRLMLARIEAQPLPEVTTSWGLGETYALLEDQDKAYQWMQKALEGDYGCIQARRSPWLEPVRSDARFRLLLEAYCDLSPTEQG